MYFHINIQVYIYKYIHKYTYINTYIYIHYILWIISSSSIEYHTIVCCTSLTRVDCQKGLQV